MSKYLSIKKFSYTVILAQNNVNNNEIEPKAYKIQVVE